MYPICITSMALVLSGDTSASGLTVLAKHIKDGQTNPHGPR